VVVVGEVVVVVVLDDVVVDDVVVDDVVVVLVPPVNSGKVVVGTATEFGQYRDG
jgi:hypothetical protein